METHFREKIVSINGYGFPLKGNGFPLQDNEFLLQGNRFPLHGNFWQNFKFVFSQKIENFCKNF
jgi:hypothetical protein